MREHESDPVFGEVVLRYTIREAEEEGILVSTLEIWERSPISDIPSNLLSQGYLKEKAGVQSELSMPNLVDLVNRALEEIEKHSPTGKVRDFYSFRGAFPEVKATLCFS